MYGPRRIEFLERERKRLQKIIDKQYKTETEIYLEQEAIRQTKLKKFFLCFWSVICGILIAILLFA